MLVFVVTMTRTLLYCHHDAPLDLQVLARWMSSWSTLAGIVVITERSERTQKRVRRELKRVGPLRFADVLAFRAFYKARLAAADRAWERQTISVLARDYPELPDDLPILHTHSPNSDEAREFAISCKPDIAIARCKFILKKNVFTVPSIGTFVLHPGICPEYRNAHGCFWALAEDDLARVGTTLLKIDEGIDTGPVYGYYSYAFDEVGESHIVIQQRTLFDNLGAIALRFGEIISGEATPKPTEGRSSNVWGQPWLSKYTRWKWRARRRRPQSSTRSSKR